MGSKDLRDSDLARRLSIWAVVSLTLYALTAYWASIVSSVVPAPYLDEVFHVRQAQAYCAGRLNQWDPKITTPPGLYLLSLMLYRATFPCTIKTLRETNAGLLSVVLFNVCLQLLVHSPVNGISISSGLESASPSQATRIWLRKIHTSLNVALFPPLFFFAALYYTDVGSTALVLAGIWLQQHPVLVSYPKLRGSLLILNGGLALLFRQTNVLWVGIFPAALDLVATLNRDASSVNYPTLSNLVRPALKEIARRSWVEGVIYDPPYDFAAPEDFFLVAFSIGIAAVAKISIVVWTLTPYLILVTSFVGFILWNGSIVLGDKSNHVATLHLPQMLYIWPFVVFFSFPLIYPHVMGAIFPSNSIVKAFIGPYKSHDKNERRHKHTIIYSVAVLLSILLVIYKNTIVHPFTLADNRHYVFYVFRILLRHPSIRYIVAPVYLVCGWAALQTFCTPSSSEPEGETARKEPTGKDLGPRDETRRLVPASYVLIWLITTALTLVTAPLVEPRYFIVPWIFWRLWIPGPPLQPIRKPAARVLSQKGERELLEPPNSMKSRIRYMSWILNHGDHRLYFETAWFLAVNAVTGYIFLYWGFEWPQERENVQRFMW